jgi:hypothetical protein
LLFLKPIKNKTIVIAIAIIGNKTLSDSSDITTITVANQTKNIVIVTKAYFMINSHLNDIIAQKMRTGADNKVLGPNKRG